MVKAARDTRTGDRHAGQQITMRLDGEQMALLEKLGASHGGKKAAVVAGLVALAGRGEPSKAELLAMLARRLK